MSPILGRDYEIRREAMIHGGTKPMNARCLALILLAALLISCGQGPDLATFSTQPLKLTTFRCGRPVIERNVSPPSREHELLAAWASKHKSDWKRSYVTYAPGILVTGTNFTLNIQSSRVILNIGGDQYVHEAPASDFGFLSR